MADDNLREMRGLAEAGERVLGDSAWTLEHSCRHGDWLCFGMLLSAAIVLLLPVSPWWLIPSGLFVGYLVNERERKTMIAKNHRVQLR